MRRRSYRWFALVPQNGANRRLALRRVTEP